MKDNMNRARDRFIDYFVGVLIFIAVIVGISVFAGAKLASKTVTKMVTKKVYVQHPAGLHELVKFRETTVMGALTKKCRIWANFTPTPTLPFKEGQRFVSDCRIVRSRE